MTRQLRRGGGRVFFLFLLFNPTVVLCLRSGFLLCVQARDVSVVHRLLYVRSPQDAAQSLSFACQTARGLRVHAQLDHGKNGLDAPSIKCESPHQRRVSAKWNVCLFVGECLFLLCCRGCVVKESLLSRGRAAVHQNSQLIPPSCVRPFRAAVFDLSECLSITLCYIPAAVWKQLQIVAFAVEHLTTLEKQLKRFCISRFYSEIASSIQLTRFWAELLYNVLD